MNYDDFLSRKIDYGAEHGFEPLFMPDFLFDFQIALTDWAVRKGRAAIFADCGMGKTPMQLVWAQNVVQKTCKPVLILTPLAVSHQTLNEADKFNIEANRATEVDSELPVIQVTNYEKLHYFDASDYAGIVCDESSILKNFDGKRKSQITEFMRMIPYRLLCTATAAPNDWVELGTSSEALGYLGHTDMLTKFFTTKNKSIKARRMRHQRDKWRLKGHAEEPFWRWVASWARACRRPSDLGFNDGDFVLLPLVETDTSIEATRPTPGMLFDVPATNFFEEREAIRRTIQERCEAVAEKVELNGRTSMVWCHLNDEGDLLEQLMPNAVQVAGRDSDEKKEEAARWFVESDEKSRVLISKPTIFGFGLNFQHCAHMTYFPTHSYEQYYQAIRRLWRFGQTRPVTVHRIFTDGSSRMLENLDRKAKAADKMFDRLVHFMDQGLHVKESYERKEIEIPQWMR
jgi:hypothetical protein